MSQEMDRLPPVEPPADVPEIQRGNWLALPPEDPVVEYVRVTLWDRREQPTSWEVARLSNTAYVYREASTGWAVVAKFYVVKAGASAQKYAARERDSIHQVRTIGMGSGKTRAVEALALWRGALFLEYVPGLTLENIIAVRQSQPGGLSQAISWAGRCLVALHTRTVREDEEPSFGAALRYAHEVVEQLAEHGVLQDYPIAREGLTGLIDSWAAKSEMEEFVPCLTHGDATTTNFVFPQVGGVVILDWERLRAGDPASDLGRLMAEITHSINQHGGSVAEAGPFVQHLADAYRGAQSERQNDEALLSRARFYRASSTLRIARNGWVSRRDRTALVAQAMALLTGQGCSTHRPS